MTVNHLISTFTAALLCLLLCACSGGNNEATAVSASQVHQELTQTPPETRLPAGIAPTAYRLHLSIDPRQQHFYGEVEIDIDIETASSLIWLHGKSLDLTKAYALAPGGEKIKLQWAQHTPAGVASLAATRPLPSGKSTLMLTYKAPFDTNLDGLYKVSEHNDAYAYTQFESTSARMAFPSFDEPAFKVPFDIKLTVPQAFEAITNTPVISENTESEGYKTITFATSKPLPTYLIAFAVGPFDIIDWQAIPANQYREQPIPLRGVTTRGKGEQVRYALSHTQNIVLDMEDYFDTRYPYAKLDLLAVPDFRAGAMENAGAITYREQLLLLDERSSVRQKRNFLVTHAHELAHQWFGNLVTPVWWDDIWLNESFATWNASIILDRLYPTENYRESLASSSHWVMRRDGLASARQIREPINRHADIGSAFNGITYLKGGGVLTMFEAFLGRDNFRDGIRQYMKQHAFGNTTAYDFIDAIAQANPQVQAEDLTAAFNSFIEQPGLPVLSVDLDCSRAAPALEIDQRRYLPAGSEGDSTQSWTIPACFTTWTAGNDGTSECFLLREQSKRITLTSETCPTAVMPNSEGSSYYRWSLQPTQWQSLLMRFPDLSAAEQISVADSLSAALNDGSLPLSDYLDAVPTITDADSYRVAMAPGNDLYKIKEFLLNKEQQTIFEHRLQRLYQPRLAELEGLQALTADQKEFRSRLLSTLALQAKDTQTRSALLADAMRYTGFQTDRVLRPKAIDANIRLAALQVAVEEEGTGFTDLLWQHFLSSSDALEREHLLQSMAWSKDATTASMMRERILSPDLRDNEIYSILRYQMARGSLREKLWQWTQANLNAVLGRIPSQNRGQLVRVFNKFCSDQSAASVSSVFSPMIATLESGPRYLANTLETIRLCASFVELHQASAQELTNE